MIEISIDPVAFRLGPLAITWYGIMMVLAIITVVFVAASQAPRYGLKKDDIYTLGIWAVVAGLLGAKLIHIFDQWRYYFTPEHWLDMFSFAGFGVYGAIIGAFLATAIFAWRKKLSFWLLGDSIAPAALLGQAVGRIGCILNGCCYGDVCDLPWAFIYTNPATYGPLGLPVQPAHLYLLLWNLAAFGIIWSLRGRVKPPGSLLLLYVAVYSLGDFAIRIFRINENTPWFMGWPQGMVVGFALFIAFSAWFTYRVVRAKRRKPDADAKS